MQGRFFVITLNCRGRASPTDAIERALAAYDWLRFGPESYFVYAAGVTSFSIYSAIKPVLHADDLIMVTPIDSAERYGWTLPVSIEWFNRPRS